MKSKLSSVSVIILSVMMLAATAAPAFAWKVSVTNETPYEAAINIFVNAVIINVNHETKVAGPGQTVTFDTGGLCPSGLWGLVRDVKTGSLVPKTSLLGLEVPDTLFTACCWDSEWVLYRTSGYQPYHFRKK